VDAAPLSEDCVLKVASATKLITSIALLQCVDNGLIGLDDPLTTILPELNGKEILKSGSTETGLASAPSLKKITARHLLSHTSGLAYRFLNPLLMKWAKTPAGQQNQDSHLVAEKYNVPLVFEPGAGWAYGVSLDWAGVAVSRLNNKITLEDYMIENIWKKVGLSDPFPTFHISKHPDYKARLMQAAERGPGESLRPFEFWQGDSPDGGEAGGHDLVCTAKDWIAVLADLVSDDPKLLRTETIELMFEPQITAGSPGMEMLLQLRPAWEAIAGSISNDAVNHGLGGLLLTGPVPEIGQPANLLVWGGASNIVWWVSREKGLAGFFATQIQPFGDSVVKELINAWKKDFWFRLNKTI
jgi:CubicO group peptidase (beta-lactamase class C family)